MSTPQGTHGGMATFNIQHGFVEALVRGMRSSFLADADYHHLTQCETLEDVKLNLSETDYGTAIADLGGLNPAALQEAAITKVREGSLRCDGERMEWYLRGYVSEFVIALAV